MAPSITRANCQRRPKPGAADLRGFEWRYLWRTTDQHEVTRTLAGLPQSVGADVTLVRVGDTLYNLDYSKNELRSWNMTDWTPLPSRLPSHPAFDRWFWHPYQQTALAVDNTNRTLTLYQLPGFQKGRSSLCEGLPHVQPSVPNRRLLRRVLPGRTGNGVVWDLLENA